LEKLNVDLVHSGVSIAVSFRWEALGG